MYILPYLERANKGLEYFESNLTLHHVDKSSIYTLHKYFSGTPSNNMANAFVSE